MSPVHSQSGSLFYCTDPGQGSITSSPRSTRMIDSLVRKAGLLERWFLARHYVGHDSCVIVASKYTSSDTLDKPLLYAALAKLIQAHAALGVYVKNEATKEPSFFRLQAVNLDHVVTFVEDDDVARVIERELLRPFDTAATAPLWRLSVLTDNTVLFMFHHAIGDGKSGVAFHKALLSTLNTPSLSSQDQDSSTVAIPSSIDLVAPVEKVLDLSLSLTTIFRGLCWSLVPSSWTKDNTAWTGNSVVRSPHCRSNCRILHFPSDESSRFLEVCHTNKATLSSTFYVLAACAISRLIADQSSGHKTIASAVPVSLRELCHTSSEVLCNHLSTFYVYTPTNQTEFSWQASSAMASTLRSGVKTSLENVSAIQLLFGNEIGYHKGLRGKKRGLGFRLSNVGKFPGTLNPDDRWKITQVVFSQCDAVGGAALKLNVAGDPEGGITVSVTWGHEAVDDSFAESFISEFRRGYSELIGVSKDR